jgi:hypothetical protein
MSQRMKVNVTTSSALPSWSTHSARVRGGPKKPPLCTQFSISASLMSSVAATARPVAIAVTAMRAVKMMSAHVILRHRCTTAAKLAKYQELEGMLF